MERPEAAKAVAAEALYIVHPVAEAMAEAEENFKTKKDLGCLKMASRL